MSQDDRSQSPGEAFRDAVPPGADAVEPRDSTHQPVPRRPWRALWYAVPAVLIVFLGMGWMLWSELQGDRAPSSDVIGTTGNDPEGARRDALNPRPEGPAVVSDMELLSDAGRYVGRTARFAAVPVSTTHGARTFSVGRFGSRALVLAEQGVDVAGFDTGTPVSLEGRIERAPSREQLDRMGLSEKDREALEDAEVFIRASRVERVTQDVGGRQAETPEEDRSSGDGEK